MRYSSAARSDFRNKGGARSREGTRGVGVRNDFRDIGNRGWSAERQGQKG